MDVLKCSLKLFARLAQRWGRPNGCNRYFFIVCWVLRPLRRLRGLLLGPRLGPLGPFFVDEPLLFELCFFPGFVQCEQGEEQERKEHHDAKDLDTDAQPVQRMARMIEKELVEVEIEATQGKGPQGGPDADKHETRSEKDVPLPDLHNTIMVHEDKINIY